MISDENIKIVKNSASIITSYGPEITERMYEILFTLFPNAKKYFANAPTNQFMKLSDALSAYAINIDKIDKFRPALMVIAQRHVQYDISSSMYPMVKKSLLRAMQEIFNEKGVGGDICLDAWSEAYDYLAEILIEMENDLYDKL